MAYLFLLLCLAITPAQASDTNVRFNTIGDSTFPMLEQRITTVSALAMPPPPITPARTSSSKPLMLDFARDVVFWGDASAKQIAYDWLATHIMASEDQSGSREEYLARNPNFKTWK